MRICSGAGCTRTVPDDVRFCYECAPDARIDDTIKTHSPGNTDRTRYKFLYEGNRFQDGIRPSILQRDINCQRCRHAPSVIVDHIVPAGEAIRQVIESGRYPYDRYAGFFLKSNLQGLCRSCHGLKTVEDKAHQGAWPSVLARHDSQPVRVFKL